MDWLEGVIKTDVETSVDENTNSRDDKTSVKTLDTMEMTSYFHLKTANRNI